MPTSFTTIHIGTVHDYYIPVCKTTSGDLTAYSIHDKNSPFCARPEQNLRFPTIYFKHGIKVVYRSRVLTLNGRHH